jgi:hypothetical protein
MRHILSLKKFFLKKNSVLSGKVKKKKKRKKKKKCEGHVNFFGLLSIYTKCDEPT